MHSKKYCTVILVEHVDQGEEFWVFSSDDLEEFLSGDGVEHVGEIQ